MLRRKGPDPDEDRERVRLLLTAELLRFMEDAAALEAGGWFDDGIEPPCPHCPAWLRLKGVSKDAWPNRPDDVWDVVQNWDLMKRLAAFLGHAQAGLSDAEFLRACRNLRAVRARDALGTAEAVLLRLDSERTELLRRIVAAYLAEHPRASWREIWETVPNPYQSHRSMKASLWVPASGAEQLKGLETA